MRYINSLNLILRDICGKIISVGDTVSLAFTDNKVWVVEEIISDEKEAIAKVSYLNSITKEKYYFYNKGSELQL